MLKAEQLASDGQTGSRHDDHFVELLHRRKVQAEAFPTRQVDQEVRKPGCEREHDMRQPSLGRLPQGRCRRADEHEPFAQTARAKSSSQFDPPRAIREYAGRTARIGIDQCHLFAIERRQGLREMETHRKCPHALATRQKSDGVKCTHATRNLKPGVLERRRVKAALGIDAKRRPHGSPDVIGPSRRATTPSELKTRDHDALRRSHALALGLVFSISWLLVSTPAHAKASLQAQMTASAGWSDNPDNTANTGDGPRSDLIFVLSPGLVLTTGTPRAVQQLSYFFGATLFARETKADSFSNTLTWSGFFLPSRITTLALTAGVTQTRLNGFSAGGESANAQFQVLPTGVADLLTATAAQRFGWEFYPRWRLEEATAAGATIQLDHQSGQNNQFVTPSLSIQRLWARDLGALDLAVTYSNYEAVRGLVVGKDGVVQPNGILTPRQQTLFNQGMLRWRHDYGHFISSELGAGAVAILSAVDGSGRIIEPVGLAALRFFYQLFQTDLSYQRTAAPDTLIGQSFLYDGVTLRTVTLLGHRSGLSLSGAVGYQHARQIHAGSNHITGITDAVSADATLTFTPRLEVGFFLRYQFLDQIGDDTGAPGTIPSLQRNTLLFGVRGVYPGRASAIVPKGVSRRADGSDLVAIPEPHTKDPN
jgi:hypothetical protein